MNSQIIAIGEPEIIKKIISEKVYMSEGNTFVINVEMYDQPKIMAELQNRGIEVCHKAKMDYLLETDHKFVNYEPIDKETVYDWLKRGAEHFGIVQSKEFLQFSLEKEIPKVVNKIRMVESIRFSNTGAFIACFGKNMVVFYVNETQNKVLELEIEGVVEDVLFYNSDRYVAIISTRFVVVYHLLKFKEIFKANRKDFCFTNDGFYYDIIKYKIIEENTINKIYACEDSSVGIKSTAVCSKLINNLKALSHKYEFKSFVKASGNQIVEYLYDNISKLTYRNGDKVQFKTTNWIVKENIYFSKSNMYVITVKFIQKKISYDIETFSESGVTVNNLESAVQSIAVSDKYFVIYDKACNLIFYVKNKYSYYVLRKIKKEECSGIVSTMNGMTCFYNSISSNLEFYDIVSINNKLDVKLKCVYAHQGCTGLKWSDSGLFLAVYSAGTVNGLLQIFNVNGKLIYRKTHGGLSEFEWRHFKKLSDESKAKIGMMPEDFCKDEFEKEEDVKDIAILLSEWKAYLTNKLNVN